MKIIGPQKTIITVSRDDIVSVRCTGSQKLEIYSLYYVFNCTSVSVALSCERISDTNFNTTLNRNPQARTLSGLNLMKMWVCIVVGSNIWSVCS